MKTYLIAASGLRRDGPPLHGRSGGDLLQSDGGAADGRCHAMRCRCPPSPLTWPRRPRPARLGEIINSEAKNRRKIGFGGREGRAREVHPCDRGREEVYLCFTTVRGGDENVSIRNFIAEIKRCEMLNAVFSAHACSCASPGLQGARGRATVYTKLLIKILTEPTTT